MNGAMNKIYAPIFGHVYRNTLLWRHSSLRITTFTQNTNESICQKWKRFWYVAKYGMHQCWTTFSTTSLWRHNILAYMYYLTVTPMYSTLRGRAVGVTTMWSLVAPCCCDNNLRCRGVVIVTAPPPPPPCLMYTLKRIYICRVSDDDTHTDILSHWLWGKMAGIPQQTTFANVYC